MPQIIIDNQTIRPSPACPGYVGFCATVYRGSEDNINCDFDFHHRNSGFCKTEAPGTRGGDYYFHIYQCTVHKSYLASYAYGCALLRDDARWDLPTFERPMVYGQKAEASSSGLKVVVHLYQTRNDIPYHNLHTHTHRSPESRSRRDAAIN